MVEFYPDQPHWSIFLKNSIELAIFYSEQKWYTWIKAWSEAWSGVENKQEQKHISLHNCTTILKNKVKLYHI